MIQLESYDPYTDRKGNDENRSAEAGTRRMLRKDAILTVVIDTVTSLLRSNPGQTAASISYYTLFSLFPMLLFSIIILSYFMETTTVYHEFLSIFQNVFPGQERFVIENLQNIMSRRTATGITAAITLLWSGSGAFTSVISNIQKAWPESRGRGYFVNRAFAMVGIILLLAVLIVIVFGTVAVEITEVVPVINLNFDLSKVLRVIFNLIFSYVLPVLLLYTMFFLLYYYVPAAHVDRQAAVIGSWTAAILIRLFIFFFSIFILSPFNRYDVIYGSLTVIMLFLLEVFLIAYILIFCAHLVAAITHYKVKRLVPEPDQEEYLLQPIPSAHNHGPSQPHLSNQAQNAAAGSKRSAMLRQKARDITFSVAGLIPGLRKRLSGLVAHKNWPAIKTAIGDFFNSLFRWK